MECRDDIIIAYRKVRSSNQVNNVLGFPYILGGAMDVKLTEINENMKLAACKSYSANVSNETVVDE